MLYFAISLPRLLSKLCAHRHTARCTRLIHWIFIIIHSATHISFCFYYWRLWYYYCFLMTRSVVAPRSLNFNTRVSFHICHYYFTLHITKISYCSKLLYISMMRLLSRISFFAAAQLSIYLIYSTKDSSLRSAFRHCSKLDDASPIRYFAALPRVRQSAARRQFTRAATHYVFFDIFRRRAFEPSIRFKRLVIEFSLFSGKSAFIFIDVIRSPDYLRLSYFYFAIHFHFIFIYFHAFSLHAFPFIMPSFGLHLLLVMILMCAFYLLAWCTGHIFILLRSCYLLNFSRVFAITFIAFHLLMILKMLSIKFSFLLHI